MDNKLTVKEFNDMYKASQWYTDSFEAIVEMINKHFETKLEEVK